jgi:4-hydroxy-2-oxoheptanedioate aldolase
MNQLERKMVETLLDLRENHHVVGVKAEFEAEGTRLEEAMRLKEVISAAGLGLTMKIGGCEALRDMYEARVIGVERVVGPMIESAYALQKFLAAAKLVFPESERDEVQFCVNVETAAGVDCFDAMLALPEIDLLGGVVLGRVDMTGSLGMARDDVNSPRIFEITRGVFEKAKAKGMECAVGGGVGGEALEFLRNLGAGFLDRYETRKVVFGCPGGLGPNADKGILKAVGFELMWLKNKRDFYGCIFEEDRTRIDMLQSRYDRLIHEAGGLTD